MIIKPHSIPPNNNDALLVTYIINGNVVNFPLRSRKLINIYKNSAFTLVGVWSIKK